ncbi:MAG: symporter small accessory protein [Candidatus Firestonebacteria bacterium]
MFGFEGTGVLLAYVLTILAAILCIVYGIVNWNKSGENENKEAAEEAKWEKKDSKVKSKL